MKKPKTLLLILVAGFGLAQLFRPQELGKETPVEELSGVPEQVTEILRNSCFDCHSSETNWRWYDKITPANFMVASHVRDGREVLDFSKWDSLQIPQRNALIYYSVNKILSDEMPLPSYTAVHRSAKLSQAEIETLKKYASSIAVKATTSSKGTSEAEDYKSHPNKLLKGNDVKPSLNGMRYIPGYRNWKVISTTDRFDNGTMRIIFANDVAVKAIENHQTDIWPDGTIFAKAAWKQQELSDGSISMGEFVQVEFMVKDEKKYEKTYGWGWGRWKGMDLKPYGKSISFDKECMSCHKPMKNQDYVFTSPLFLTSKFQRDQQK